MNRTIDSFIKSNLPKRPTENIPVEYFLVRNGSSSGRHTFKKQHELEYNIDWHRKTNPGTYKMQIFSDKSYTEMVEEFII